MASSHGHAARWQGCAFSRPHIMLWRNEIMKHTRHLLLVGAVAALAALTVAQSGSQSGSQPTGSQTSSHAQAKEHSGAKGPHVCLADDLIGMSVVSPQGEKLGKIEDVVVHPGGEVAYAVLSFGGFLGMGDKLFAVPWHMLKPHDGEGMGKSAYKEKDKDIDKDKDKEMAEHAHKPHGPLVLAVEKERLKSAPGFDKNHWPEMANADWAMGVDQYYASADARHEPTRITDADAPRSTVIWRLSELKGFDVESPSNTKLGDIKDVGIDTNGRASYVVISVGGALGVGSKLIAAPWDALAFSREVGKDKKRITLSMSKERLEQAPQFNKDNEAEACDPAWIGKVYDFYSIRPYWKQRFSDSDPTQDK
jgi:sporulation protein YlmC with PRC-barrel domain